MLKTKNYFGFSGNPSDKIIFARNNKRRSASFPAPKSPDRRGSFRLWGSTRRLRRSASTRTLARHYTDSSSSTEYPTSSDSAQTPSKYISIKTLRGKTCLKVLPINFN